MPAWLIPAAVAGITALGNYLSQRHAAKKQQQSNMQLAKFQASANESYLSQQLAYNTPQAQMSRFDDAGLNRNLIYGQGNPGNQSAPLTHPDVGRVDLQSMSNVMPTVTQSALAASQVQAINAKTRHTYAMTELNKLQQDVLKRNPLLNETGFNAIINGLKSAAEIKASDASMKGLTESWFVGNTAPFKEGGKSGFPGVDKLNAELHLLEQRFDLGTQDQGIKAQILKSKEFQNAILEIQKKFMTDAEVTPQHVLTFIQLLLMKIL